MATPFWAIYDKFLMRVNSYELANLTDEMAEKVMRGYLDIAIFRFKLCRNNLLDTTDKWFVANLTFDEQHILAMGMVLAWVEPRIKEEKLMRKDIQDRDWRESGGHQTLSALMEMEFRTRRELKVEMNKYTWQDFRSYTSRGY